MSSNSRKALASVVAAALLTAIAPVGGPAATAAPAASSASVQTVTTRVGTYNIRAGVSVSTFRQAVGDFAPQVDLAGLQEVNNKDKEAVLADLSGFAYYRGARHHGEQNPVIWRRGRFSRVSARAVQISPSWYIGNEVPSKGSRIGEMEASVVRLRDTATGKPVSLINVHLVPGAVAGGHKVPGRTRLYRLYLRQMANVAELVRTERTFGRVFVTGDFNCGWVADERLRRTRLPFMTFRRHAFRSNWATGAATRPRRLGTHNDALIDQIYSPYRATSATVMKIGYSDHRPGLGTYELPVG